MLLFVSPIVLRVARPETAWEGVYGGLWEDCHGSGEAGRIYHSACLKSIERNSCLLVGMEENCWMDGCWVASNDEGTNGINQAKGLFLLLHQINKTELKISCPPYSYVSYLAINRSTSRESGDLQLTDRSRSSLYLCVDPAPLPLLPDFSTSTF